MMQKNPKLLVILGIFCLLLIIGLIWSGHHTSSKSQGAISSQQLIKDKASGDNENEVLRTVLANQEALKTQNKELETENEALKTKGMQNVQTMIQASKQDIEQQLDKMKSSFDSDISSQKKDISHLKTSFSQNESQDKSGYTINGDSWNVTENDGKTHIIGTVNDLSNGISGSATSHSNSSETTDNSAEPPTLPSDLEKKNDNATALSDDQKNTITPFYTIPANSTLNHVKLMTAIIGEVPVSGKLLAPAFPFKAIIGKKELYAANGISIPEDLAGTVIQGYSVGNMTLSCARIYVTRILFVFNDGHFVVFPAKDDNDDAMSLYPQDALGYLSDSYGNTCIPGHYITDAPKVIANLALLGGINTGANAVATSQFTTMNNGNAMTSGFTGNMSKLVGASIIGGGSQEVMNWYKQRVDDVFDAVFIPASFQHRPTNLVLNITKTIPIDLNQKGRTIRYENQNALSDMFKKLD